MAITAFTRRFRCSFLFNKKIESYSATLLGGRRFSAAAGEEKSSLKMTEAAKFAAMADKWSLQGKWSKGFIIEIPSSSSRSTIALMICHQFGGGPGCLGINSIHSPSFAFSRWDYEGPYKPLHLMNPTRISFIRSALCQHFRKDPNNVRPFEGLRIIDVGCGGGLLAEPLARMGAQVTGIDVLEKNINIASVHAVRDPLTASIDYQCTTAEHLVQEGAQFDAVVALEVIEHVAHPQEFCKSLAALTIDNGAVFISTINRTIRSYLMAIVAAEYILGWLPRGTHDWSNLITPHELVLLMKRASILVQEMAGFTYDPLSSSWTLSNNTDVNYIAFGVKNNI